MKIKIRKRYQEEIEFIKKTLKERNYRPLSRNDYRQGLYSRKFGPSLMMAMSFIKDGRINLAEERLTIAYWYGKLMGNKRVKETIDKIRTKEFTNIMQIQKWYANSLKER